MKIALSIWKNRISPVFDVACQVLVVEVDQGQVMDRTLENLPDIPGQRLATLRDLKVQALVCGAISQPLVDQAYSLGMEVMPFVAGDVEDVVTACVTGALDDPCFAMPGCQGPHRRYARACTCSPCERRGSMSNQDGQGPRGNGQGQGLGRGKGRGRGKNLSDNKGRQGNGKGLGRGQKAPAQKSAMKRDN